MSQLRGLELAIQRVGSQEFSHLATLPRRKWPLTPELGEHLLGEAGLEARIRGHVGQRVEHLERPHPRRPLRLDER